MNAPNPAPAGGVAAPWWIPSGKDVLAAGVLFLLVFLLYWPVLNHGFVDYDDPVYVSQNAWVQAGLSWQGLRLSLREVVCGNWHPLAMWSHMLDAELFGANSAGHHFQSVCWHAANVVLLFGLLRRLASGFWRPLAVAALWAVHPLNVDSVAWIAERKNLLCMFFWLATVGGYAAYVRRPTFVRFLAVAGGMALALLAKPMAITLPFTLLLLDFWPLRRAPGFGRGVWATWRTRLAEKLPLFVLTAVFVLTTLRAQTMAGATEMGPSLPWPARIAWLPIYYVDYLRLFFWPRGLCVLYPAPMGGPNLPASAGAALLLGLVSWAAVRWMRHRPWLPVGWGWFLGTLVPVIGLVPVGVHRIADRYTYVSMLGLLVALVWTVPGAARLRGRVLAGLAAAAVVVALGLATRHQLPSWQSSEALFRRALAVTTDNYVMHYNLARQLLDQKRYDETMFHLRETLRIQPRYFKAHNNVGWVWLLRKRPDLALDPLREALRIEPRFFLARKNLALALEGLGRYSEARAEYATLLRQAPGFPGAQEGYQRVSAKSGTLP